MQHPQRRALAQSEDLIAGEGGDVFRCQVSREPDDGTVRLLLLRLALLHDAARVAAYGLQTDNLHPLARAGELVRLPLPERRVGDHTPRVEELHDERPPLAQHPDVDVLPAGRLELAAVGAHVRHDQVLDSLLNAARPLLSAVNQPRGLTDPPLQLPVAATQVHRRAASPAVGAARAAQVGRRQLPRPGRRWGVADVLDLRG
mmetsp:Transcript_18228/g.46154  ORF Transcript_18228/g.46154 Transcript_18228/m.46154 type:complete len:202 (-) Transcript_18228:434-1039(-)